jgi:hypothetical protein
LLHIGGEYMLLGRFGSGALKFFVLQPVAIILEKVVASAWARFNPVPPAAVANGNDTKAKQPNGLNGNGNGVKGLSPNTSKNGERSQSRLERKIVGTPPVWLRCVGYVWVFAWFVLTLPFIIDPMVPLGIFIDSRVDLRTFAWIS